MSSSKSESAFGPVGRIVVTAVIAVSILSAFGNSAEARRRQRAAPYSPPFASIVVDVKTGKVLQATNPDAARHPASITKVMTLYMLFEQLERGRFTLQSDLKISAHAARQAPSKIGLKPGETISVEDAIKAVVTKSANDIAAAIGENIGGSEERFSEMMTQKAHAIGMKSTTFVNASGLPDPEQVTTARDLATLGRAIQDRFPKYYAYFGTRVFNYDGASYRNHNKLLGRVDGVDGIKTGYTRASGFNLLTSAKSDGRHVIAVVLGGRSGRARDAQVAGLVEEHLPRAYAGARQTPRLVEVASADEDDKPAARVSASVPTPAERPRTVISTGQSVTAGVMAAPAPEARPRPAVVAELPPQRPSSQSEPSPRVGQPLALTGAGGSTNARPGSAPLALAASTTPSSPALRWNVGPQPSSKSQARLVPPGSIRYTNSADTTEEADLDQPLPPSNKMTDAQAAAKPSPVNELDRSKPAAVAAVTPAAKPAPVDASKARSGWVIQLGATDDEDKARDLLDKAKSSQPKVLAEADGFTEKVLKGDSTLYRARFSGFESGEAETACKVLKRSGFSCFAQRL